MTGGFWASVIVAPGEVRGVGEQSLATPYRGTPAIVSWEVSRPRS